MILLQIPPPKPPPPEMHFIPNPANTEFIYLCGLEECVSRILNLDLIEPSMPQPFTCSQCGTDFTPTWKWDKTAKGKIILLFLTFKQWCLMIQFCQSILIVSDSRLFGQNNILLSELLLVELCYWWQKKVKINNFNSNITQCNLVQLLPLCLSLITLREAGSQTMWGEKYFLIRAEL